MVRAAVQAGGGLGQVLQPNARIVAIKTNLVELKQRGDGTVTDWRVVRAVARMVHEIAPRATVKVVETCNWDAPGGGPNGETGEIDGWTLSGYRELEAEPYIRLVSMNLDSTYARSLPRGGVWRNEYPVSVTMDTVDCFIDVPVVKIIGAVCLTAGMKNMVGMLPVGAGRTPRHILLPHPQSVLDEGIVDLNLLHPVDFVVADAIVTLERAKTTSWDGSPVRMNTVLASADVVAADAISARLIGLNPDDIEYLTLAERLGMGVANTDRIEVAGDAISRIGRRFARSPDLTDRFGQTPKIWTLRGPFPTDDPGDVFVDPARSVIPGEDGWTELTYSRTDRINFKEFLGDARNCVAYAYTEFSAPRDGPADLWVGSGEAMTIWIDGEVVYDYAGRRRHKLPTELHRIELTAGHHRLLVKAYQGRGSFDFSLNTSSAWPSSCASLQIGIRRPFGPDGSLGPVPRVDDRLVGQGKQLLTDTVEQGLHLSPRQVAAADGAGEQRVTTENDPAAVEGHATGAVPRHVQDRERAVAHAEFVAVGQLPVGRRGHRVRLDAEHGGLLSQVVVELPVPGVQVHLGAGLGHDALHALHVIQVPVGQPYRLERQALALQPVEEHLGVFAGIDEDGLRGGWRCYQVAVFLKHSRGETDDPGVRRHSCSPVVSDPNRKGRPLTSHRQDPLSVEHVMPSAVRR